MTSPSLRSLPLVKESALYTIVSPLTVTGISYTIVTSSNWSANGYNVKSNCESWEVSNTVIDFSEGSNPKKLATNV